MPKGLQLATAYTAHGSKLDVVLHTTSLTGRPTLTVNGHSYHGDQIRLSKHEIGSLSEDALQQESVAVRSGALVGVGLGGDEHARQQQGGKP